MRKVREKLYQQMYQLWLVVWPTNDEFSRKNDGNLLSLWKNRIPVILSKLCFGGMNKTLISRPSIVNMVTSINAYNFKERNSGKDGDRTNHLLLHAEHFLMCVTRAARQFQLWSVSAHLQAPCNPKCLRPYHPLSPAGTKCLEATTGSVLTKHCSPNEKT